MSINYEWVFEEIDEYGDIVDPLFSDTLQDAKSNTPNNPNNDCEIALVCNWVSESDELIDREYLYIEKGKLPIEFANGHKVPKKFHKEVSSVFK